MRAKLSALLLAVVLLLTACEGGDGNLGSDLTAPLDRILQALQEDNAVVYESAFPPDFIAGYRASHGDFSGTISTLLSATAYKNVGLYGETYTLRYQVDAKESLAVEDLASVCTLDRFDAYEYTLPKERIEKAAKITVTAYLEGGMGEEQFENIFTVVYMDGIWYLHPMHFGTVLKGI